MTLKNQPMAKPEIEYTKSYDDVISEERHYLKLDEKPVKEDNGIAISGGGIRSASFGLGVLQAMVANRQLEKMDFMSTVSGGGYIGAALTWALNQDESAGTTPDNFPLGKKGSVGNKKGRIESDKKEKEVAEENKNKIEENKLLDYIRQHGSYLAPTGELDIVSFAAVVLRSMTMSLFFYLSVLTIVMTASVYLVYNAAQEILILLDGFINPQVIIDRHNFNEGLLLLTGGFVIAEMVILGFIYSLRTFEKDANERRYRNFIKSQKSLGTMLRISMVCFVLGTLPYFTDILTNLTRKVLATGLPTLFGSAVGIWQYVQAKKFQKSNSGLSNTMIYAGSIAMFYGVFLFAYIMAVKVFLNKDLSFDHYISFGVLIVFTIVVGLCVNLNLIGPNYIWRNRLMETFMPDPEAANSNRWKAATKADIAVMENMCAGKNSKPYHIVNTNVILSNSSKVNYSGRGGDNFIVSPLYCGSDATGWRATYQFQKNTGPGVTLASAISASAAALNPNAGVSGGGVTRNKIVSILLSLLNLRLGYWAFNPNKKDHEGRANFFVPGLSSEILGRGFNETDDNLLLSDGGHFENLAFYELIRRKLKLIVVSDGACDGSFNFDDLANAIEKVRVDFGARISFIENYKSDEILPGTLGDTFFDKKYEISKKGFAIAEIIYSDGKKGKLVYLKLAVITDLSTDVYSYKGVNPTFPHQSTSDQFFDEKQFEAYRELGYSVCWQAMNSEQGKEIFDTQDKEKKDDKATPGKKYLVTLKDLNDDVEQTFQVADFLTPKVIQLKKE
jgi:hypothetical protein